MQKTLKSLFPIERWRNTKNSSIVDNESIRPKFSEFIYWQQSYVLNLKKFIYQRYSLHGEPLYKLFSIYIYNKVKHERLILSPVYFF